MCKTDLQEEESRGQGRGSYMYMRWDLWNTEFREHSSIKHIMISYEKTLFIIVMTRNEQTPKNV